MKFEIVEYDEETGHMTVDMDHDTVKSLVSYGLSRLLEEYCESVLEYKEVNDERLEAEIQHGCQPQP